MADGYKYFRCCFFHHTQFGAVAEWLLATSKSYHDWVLDDKYVRVSRVYAKYVLYMHSLSRTRCSMPILVVYTNTYCLFIQTRTHTHWIPIANMQHLQMTFDLLIIYRSFNEIFVQSVGTGSHSLAWNTHTQHRVCTCTSSFHWIAKNWNVVLDRVCVCVCVLVVLVICYLNAGSMQSSSSTRRLHQSWRSTSFDMRLDFLLHHKMQTTVKRKTCQCPHHTRHALANGQRWTMKPKNFD